MQAAQLAASVFVSLAQGGKHIGIPGPAIMGAVGMNLGPRYAQMDPHADRGLAGKPAENSDVALGDPGITALEALRNFADAGLQGP